MIFLIVPVLLMAADLGLKYYLNKNREALEGKEIAGGKARLHFLYNRGFAGNRLENRPNTVKCVSAGSVLLFAAYFAVTLRTKGQQLWKFCLAAALGGALGNTAERLAKGAVTDYLQPVRKGKKGKYVYNLADLFIVAGSATGILAVLADLITSWKK